MMVKNIIEMSGKSPKELYIKYKKKYMKLKNMIGGASEYKVSIDSGEMQPIYTIDDGNALFAVLESLKYEFIRLGQNTYLDRIKSRVIVNEKGEIKTYTLKYEKISKGGGLSTHTINYYYIDGKGNKHNLGNIEDKYEELIDFNDKQYRLVPNIEGIELPRVPGIIAFKRTDDSDEPAITKKKFLQLMSEKESRSTLYSLPAPEQSLATLPGQGLALPLLPQDFYIYTTGLGYSFNRPVAGKYFIQKWRNFLPYLLDKLPKSFHRIIIIHYDSFEEQYSSSDEIDAFINKLVEDDRRVRVEREIVSFFERKSIDMFILFSLRPNHFVFDCAYILQNHPLRGLCMNTVYMRGWEETYRGKKLKGVPVSKYFGEEQLKLPDSINGMHCPYQIYKFPPYMIDYDTEEGRFVTVFDKLQKRNQAEGTNYVIDDLQVDFTHSFKLIFKIKTGLYEKINTLKSEDPLKMKNYVDTYFEQILNDVTELLMLSENSCDNIIAKMIEKYWKKFGEDWKKF